MKRRVLQILAVMLLSLTVFVVLPTMAFAADTYRYSGKGADAYFDIQSSDGAYTSVFVFGGDFTSFSSDSSYWYMPSSGTLANIWVFQYIPGNPKTTKDDIYRDIMGYAAPVDVAVNRSLTTASLSATLNADVYEFQGSNRRSGAEMVPATTTFTVNLNWTGIGDLQRSSSNGHYRSDNFTMNSHYSDTSRNATVSGSIEDASGANIISDVTGMGRIFSTRSGETIIGDIMW